jgi:Fe-S-cluster containining protein
MANEKEERNDAQAAEAASWDAKTMEEKWSAHLSSLAGPGQSGMPERRVHYQVERDPIVVDIRNRWAGMSEEERVAGWKRLLECCDINLKEMFPICVSCGDCCRDGSPTLLEDDMELLGDERIGWHKLITLRKGEPGFSPFANKPVYLHAEMIKIRQKEGTSECIFFDDSDESCTIYDDRPTQCRVQACWDPQVAKQVAELPLLSRRKMLDGVEPMLALIDEHEKRCSFGAMRELFEDLKNTEGENVDDVLALLAFDDHVRQFARELLDVPEGVLELLFGRPLADRVKLFGFRVERGTDGTSTLMPEQDTSSSG